MKHVFFSLGYFITDLVAVANKWCRTNKCLIKRVEICLARPHQPNF